MRRIDGIERTARLATAAIAALAGLASAAGLAIDGLYTETYLGSAMRGQDLVTLLCLPVLVAALVLGGRGSARGRIVWLGVLGYLFYTYAGAAFAYRFNAFFLVYLALFSLSIVALVTTAAGISGARPLGPNAPRLPVAGFLLFIALVLAASELGQIVSALGTGRTPDLIARSEGAGNFVYVLDLGVVAPLAVAAAVGLRRRAPWADILAACLLIKAATMGLALLAMTAFSLRAGQPLEEGLTAAYATIAAGGLGMSFWFLRR